MLPRFTVRTTDKGYGVWDAGTSGWRSRPDLELAAAEAVAEMLNMREQAPTLTTGPGAKQQPPKPCQVYLDGRWWSAHLTEWRQGADGSWWGTGTCEEREWLDWVPAAWLRPR